LVAQLQGVKLNGEKLISDVTGYEGYLKIKMFS
jgi:hypothetical protein